jgi:hypothetical protein
MTVLRHLGTLEQHAWGDQPEGDDNDEQKCRDAIRGGGRQ